MKYTHKLMLALAGVVCTASAAQASNFQYANRDLDLVFRRSGNNDLEVNLGSVDFFKGLASTAPGVEFNIDSSSRPGHAYDITTQLLGTFSNVDSLTFSVIGTQGGTAGTSPANTDWLTKPRADAATQTTAPARYTASKTQSIQSQISGTGTGAAAENSPVINTTGVVSMDPGSVNSYTKRYNGASGLKGLIVSPGIENTTDSLFSTTASAITRSDLYEYLPGPTTSNADYLGFFTLYNNGAISFTPVPEAGTAGAIIGGLLLVGAMMHRNRSDSFSLGKQA